MKALKQVAPFALLVLSSVATSAASHAQPANLPVAQPGSSITIQSVDVTNPDNTKCVYGWNATIKNSGSKDINVVVKGQWGSVAFGEKTLTVPAGKSVVASTSDIPFTSVAAIWGSNPTFTVKNADAEKYFDSKSVATGIPHWTKLELSAKAGATPTSYTWSVTNPTAFAYPANELTFQAHVASSESGPWTPGGGKVGQCIAAHGSVSLPSTKPSSATHAQIDLMKGGAAIHRKVVVIQQPLALKAASQGPIPQ